MPIPLPAGLFFASQANKQVLQLETEARVRFERRLDRDFSANRADDRSDLHQRYRIGVRWKPRPGLVGFLQYQYAHTSMRTSAFNASDESSDVLQANLQFSEGNRSLTLGRQRTNLGSERLIGSAEWNNVTRAFDGIHYRDPKWELFAARVGVQQPLPGEARLAAATHRWAYGETSLIFKHDAPATGSIDLWTLTHSYRTNWGSSTFEGEFAYQFGKNLGRNHQAWAYHLQVSRPLAPKWTGSIEWNSASGGGATGTSRTFDNLYPSNRKFFGVNDMLTWRNVDHLQVTATYKPREDLQILGRLSTSWLHDRTDAWYAASGRPNQGPSGPLWDPSGNSGRHLGWEVDLEGSWRRNQREALAAGVGLFVPGQFVRRLVTNPRSQVFVYAQYAIKF